MKTVIGTRAAFENLLEERGVYKKIGVAMSTVSNWRKALANDSARNFPSIDLMEKLLHKYGATVVQEKIWSVPE